MLLKGAVSRDNKLLSCDHTLLKCDRKLISYDGEIDVSLMSHRIIQTLLSVKLVPYLQRVLNTDPSSQVYDSRTFFLPLVEQKQRFF